MIRFFKIIKNNCQFNSLPILSGILMGTSYIPFPPWALFFCFAPLWIHVLKNCKNIKQAFIAGWWTQFILSLIGFHWIAYVSHEFGYLPWSVSVLLLLIFAATVHLYFALIAALVFWVKEKFLLSHLAALLAIPSLFFIAESMWPSLFPWNLGYPLLSFPGLSDLAQHADTIGFLGLSFGVHLSNAVIAYLWIKKDHKLVLKVSVLAVIVFGIGIYLGKTKYTQWSQADRSLKTLITQGNIGNLMKIAAEQGRGFQQSIIDQYFTLTKQALLSEPNVELIVWPESAYPDDLNQWEMQKKYSAAFFQFQREIKKPILTGAYSSDPPQTIPPREYNGLFLFDEFGAQVGQAYHKTYLLAYGEYTPFYEYLPILAKFSPAAEGFGRGPGPTVMKFKDINIGLQICYESLYPGFTKDLADKDAQILVNLTNDSWFGPTFEPKQHMWMTLARAIESRRPLIRSTNTGISTVIQASGEVLEQSPLFKTWTGVFDVRYQSQPVKTFYNKYFYLVHGFFILFAGISFLLPKRKN